MLRASIVVVEYNTMRVLARCLEAIRRIQMHPAEVEVLVVDNGSPTPARDLPKRFPWIRLLETGGNLGYAGGCNAALAHCRADIIVTLNPDTEVEPDWLHALLAPLADPAVGVVGCKIYYPDSRILQHAGGILLPCGRSEHRGRGELDVGQYDAIVEVPYVCGAAIAVRRTLIDRIGYFSTAYYPAYYDDTDFCLRARRAGFRVLYTPHAVLSHEESAASDSAGLARYRSSEINRIRYIARNYSVPEVLARFLPEEAAFQLWPDRPAEELAIAAEAYWTGLRTAWSARPVVKAREVYATSDEASGDGSAPSTIDLPVRAP